MAIDLNMEAHSCVLTSSPFFSFYYNLAFVSQDCLSLKDIKGV